jgi:hypothetical protein
MASLNFHTIQVTYKVAGSGFGELSIVDGQEYEDDRRITEHRIQIGLQEVRILFHCCVPFR